MNAFVLAGGRSTRMGRDKAGLAYEGRPLVLHALERLRSLGCEARICGSRPDLVELGEVIEDRFAGCGPLAGIETALVISETDLNLFLPVDVPGMPTGFLRWMMERADRSGAAATIPRLADRPEPLCAIYSRRLLAGVQGALAAGRFRIMQAMGESAAALGEKVDLFQMESVAAALPCGCWPAELPMREWFHNVNTPVDYEWLQRLGRGATGGKRRHPIS